MEVGGSVRRLLSICKGASPIQCAYISHGQLSYYSTVLYTQSSFSGGVLQCPCVARAGVPRFARNGKARPRHHPASRIGYQAIMVEASRWAVGGRRLIDEEAVSADPRPKSSEPMGWKWRWCVVAVRGDNGEGVVRVAGDLRLTIAYTEVGRT